jgi:four helix bundle protein
MHKMQKQGYQSLTVWQKSMKLAEEIYLLSGKLPQKEQFGLCDQMKRASVSVPSNIAEGYRRGSKKDYAHFISIAHGSLSELETQVLLAQRIYPRLVSNEILELSDEIGRMLYGLSRTLRG